MRHLVTQTSTLSSQRKESSRYPAMMPVKSFRDKGLGAANMSKSSLSPKKQGELCLLENSASSWCSIRRMPMSGRSSLLTSTARSRLSITLLNLRPADKRRVRLVSELTHLHNSNHWYRSLEAPQLASCSRPTPSRWSSVCSTLSRGSFPSTGSNSLRRIATYSRMTATRHTHLS